MMSKMPELMYYPSLYHGVLKVILYHIEKNDEINYRISFFDIQKLMNGIIPKFEFLKEDFENAISLFLKSKDIYVLNRILYLLNYFHQYYHANNLICIIIDIIRGNEKKFIEKLISLVE